MTREAESVKMPLVIVMLMALFALPGCEKPQTNKSSFSSFLVQGGKSVSSPANLQFPRDHFAHPEFGIEWWYLTANLDNLQGEPIWLQWTLFRIKNPGSEQSKSVNNWTDGQFYMAHFSLHTATQHVAMEMFASGGVGNANIDSNAISINNWQLNKGPGGLPSELSLSFYDDSSDAQVDIALQLDSKAYYLLQGDAGYSKKHPQTELASYYYSLPEIKVTGSLSFHHESHQVNGQAWYDHEWSSAFLSEDFSGWSWFSIHLDDGSKLTLFTLEPTTDSPFARAWYGSLMMADGRTIKLVNEQIDITESRWQHTRIGELPVQWHIKISEFDLDLTAIIKKSQQVSPFSIAYYEGAIDISGSKSGIGFVELTR